MLDPSNWMSSPYSIHFLSAADSESALICRFVPGVLEMHVASF
jgi:hypothetical protein